MNLEQRLLNKPNITFGICVSPETHRPHLVQCLASILTNRDWFNKCEIIIIGNTSTNVRHAISAFQGPLEIILHPFDENETPKPWITRKKNLIAARASHENLCIMHDYYKLDRSWGFYHRSQEQWDILVPEIYTRKGNEWDSWVRHSDWIVRPDAMQELIDINPEYYTKLLMDVAPHENAPKYVCGLPYITNLSHIQYVSGGFMLLKTNVLREHPFNENLFWGDAEDVEWSRRVLGSRKYKLTYGMSIPVYSLKHNKWHVHEMPKTVVDDLIKYYGL